MTKQSGLSHITQSVPALTRSGNAGPAPVEARGVAPGSATRSSGRLPARLERDIEIAARLPPAARSWLAAKRRVEREAKMDPPPFIPTHVPELPPDVRAQALEVLCDLCQPLPASELAGLLTRLKTMTDSKKTTQETIELEFEFYGRELEKWPGDAVRYVLETQPGVKGWWPSWKDLEERLEVYGGNRMKLKRELEAA